MVITDNHRAGHAIRIQLPRLAERIVAEHYRLRPELAVRYGAAGRRHCLSDADFNLSFLAASIDFGDYAAWLVDLRGRRRIPAGDIADNLKVMQTVLEDVLPAEVMSLVGEHVAAGLRRVESMVP
jgi:hypothetical protein